MCRCDTGNPLLSTLVWLPWSGEMWNRQTLLTCGHCSECTEVVPLCTPLSHAACWDRNTRRLPLAFPPSSPDGWKRGEKALCSEPVSCTACGCCCVSAAAPLAAGASAEAPSARSAVSGSALLASNLRVRPAAGDYMPPTLSGYQSRNYRMKLCHAVRGNIATHGLAAAAQRVSGAATAHSAQGRLKQ